MTYLFVHRDDGSVLSFKVKDGSPLMAEVFDFYKDCEIESVKPKNALMTGEGLSFDVHYPTRQFQNWAKYADFKEKLTTVAESEDVDSESDMPGWARNAKENGWTVLFEDGGWNVVIV